MKCEKANGYSNINPLPSQKVKGVTSSLGGIIICGANQYVRAKIRGAKTCTDIYPRTFISPQEQTAFRKPGSVRMVSELQDT